MSDKRRGLGRGLGALIPTASDAQRPVDVFFPDVTGAAAAAAVAALFAFLRTLPPATNHNRPHALHFPFDSQFALAAWRMLFFRPSDYSPRSDRSPQWNRGEYLLRGLGHCDACHAARNLLGAVSVGADLGGLDLGAGVGVLGHRVSSTRSGAISGRTSRR